MREDWKEVRIKDVSNIKGRIGYRGYTVDDLVGKDEGAITLSPSNMQNGQMVYDVCSYISWGKYDESPEIKVKIGDVLFVKTGSTFGKSVRIDSLPMEATINPQICIISPYQSQSYKFFAYILQSNRISFLVDTSVIGGTIPTISQTKIGNFNIFIPPLSTQNAIADYLDKKLALIDKRINLLEQKRDKYTALRKSLINETVRLGLNPNAKIPALSEVEMKDSGIEWLGRIPKHWEVKRLKDIGFIYSGLTGKSGEDFRDDNSENNKPYIPYTNILNNQYIDVTQTKEVIVYADETQNRVKKNDIFFLMSSEDYESIGLSSLLVDEVSELYLNSFCKGFRFTEQNIFPKFINYQLRSDLFRDALRLEGRGFTRINLKIDKINSQFVALPPLSEQQAIADYLDMKTSKIDAIVENINRQIAKLAQLKKSLINECVTGEREV
jgi:type I restriction enzyme S subunit